MLGSWDRLMWRQGGWDPGVGTRGKENWLWWRGCGVGAGPELPESLGGWN